MTPFLKKYWWALALGAIVLFIFADSAGRTAGNQIGEGASEAEEFVGACTGWGIFAILVSWAANLAPAALAL